MPDAHVALEFHGTIKLPCELGYQTTLGETRMRTLAPCNLEAKWYSISLAALLIVRNILLVGDKFHFIGDRIHESYVRLPLTRTGCMSGLTQDTLSVVRMTLDGTHRLRLCYFSASDHIPYSVVCIHRISRTPSGLLPKPAQSGE
jgi:hypothetical protein